MSEAHKQALARGRREARAIKQYLEALGSRRPGRPVTAQSYTARVERLTAQIADESDPLRRVELVQRRIDAEKSLRMLEASIDLSTLESEFVKSAKAYSDRKRITYPAWREAGVPAAILKQAGVNRKA